MTDDKGRDGPVSKAEDERKKRLAEQLRANLQRRKARTRARKTADRGPAAPKDDDGAGDA